MQNRLSANWTVVILKMSKSDCYLRGGMGGGALYVSPRHVAGYYYNIPHYFLIVAQLIKKLSTFY